MPVTEMFLGYDNDIDHTQAPSAHYILYDKHDNHLNQSGQDEQGLQLEREKSKRKIQ